MDDSSSNSKYDVEKSDDLRDTSDAEIFSAADEQKDQEDKPKKRRRRKRELEMIKLEDDDNSNDDDSGSEEPISKRSRDLSMLGSPGSFSPGNSGVREPRSCVLNQRQKRKPLTRLLEQLHRNLEKKDPNQFFAWPVTDNYAPNYSTIIKKPMDFSTMKQKIDDNEYKSLNFFIADFKLMCNNAMKYNKSGTVYHKAARKLLHIGLRQLQPAKLRPLGNIFTYMYEIPIRELGFDMGKMDVKALKQTEQTEDAENGTDCDENKDQTSADDEMKIRMEAIREQHRKRLAKKAFPRMDSSGYTSLQVLVDNDGMTSGSNQRPVSLGMFTGKIAFGSATLQGFKEDRRNLVKGVKPLNYGAFGSYAPSYDSTFATLSKEESHLLYHTYGEETGLSTNDNLLKFAPDSPWNCIYNMDEMFPSRNASKKADIYDTEVADIKLDIEKLRSLAEIGVDVDFLADVEDEIIASQHDYGLRKALHNNLVALRKLETEQRERLSQPIPVHLSMVAKPSLSEQELARTVVANLKDMANRVQPQHIAPLSSIRKAMGITLAHLDTPISLDELNDMSPELASLGDQLGRDPDILTNGNTDKLKTEDRPRKTESELKNFLAGFRPSIEEMKVD